MAAVSFFFPVVGWIFWAVKKNSDPCEASQCLKWAWIGVGAAFLMGMLGG